jgi:ComF family protein
LLLSRLLDLLYPPRCLVCGLATPAGGTCPACTLELPWNTHSCRRCALPLLADGNCITCEYAPPPWELALVPFRYALPVSHIIQAFKFQRRMDRGAWLGARLQEAAENLPGEALPQALVAVPLHPSRQRQRGFNQAATLASALARSLRIEDASSHLERRRRTRPQSALSAEHRRSNVDGAFAVHTPRRRSRAPTWPPRTLQHVAVVDDVVTTGATAAAVARLLHRHGIERVDLWCCARALAVPPLTQTDNRAPGQ